MVSLTIMYLHKKYAQCAYCVEAVLQNTEVDTDKVRTGMGRIKGGLICNYIYRN